MKSLGQKLPSLKHGDEAKLSRCNEVCEQVFVSKCCKKHLTLWTTVPTGPIFYGLDEAPPPYCLPHCFSFSLYLHFKPCCFPSINLSWFHPMVASHDTQGDHWLSNNLYPRPCCRHIYYASHAAYDLAPVELALTWVIWQ